MKTSDSIVNITKALLTAQRKMEAAVKGSKNPYFKSNYADYNAVLEASKPHLNEVGIAILQPHKTTELGTFVETILLHESGEFISSETLVSVAKQNDPQALGSAITYARRYGLQSLISLPAEDDDGEKAMSRESTFTKGKTEVSSTFNGNGTKSTFKKQTTPQSSGNESW
ncbi:MAG: ERF family protein [Richelia sp. RM2_1_2]|nr:ERF family protein [Richelia sp. RM2_1_2]